VKRELFSEEHEILRDSFKKFLEKEVVPFRTEWEKARIMPRSFWKKAGEQGFLAPWLPEEYGGFDADFLCSVVQMEEFNRMGEYYLLGLNLHSDIVVPYLEAFGTLEQKKRWLPGCTSGDIITAVAMTEPNAGSDLQGQRCHT
jgi:acyl-CoA dehydrogenase